MRARLVKVRVSRITSSTGSGAERILIKKERQKRRGRKEVVEGS